jgi:hypothetical protein
MIAEGMIDPPDDTFPTSYHTPKMEIVCNSYDPGKLMY